MNSQIPIEARQTILDFVTAGTSFTAYEVTLEVRRRLGASIEVPHPEVNNIVQTMFAGGEIIGYDRRPDQTVPSATPPFRYYRIGGAVAAPFVAPTAPAIARSNLPAALQFGAPFEAMIRNLGIAARDFQRASGRGDEPFAVWLPTLKVPMFRLRGYGVGWQNAEIERRFALDLRAPGDADLLWLAALAYADEFRLYSNRAGRQTQFLIGLDAAMQTTATQETERATGEPDGVEIEVAIRNREINFGERALQIYRHMSVAPRVYRDGQALQIAASEVVSEGQNWKLTGNSEPLAIVDEVAYSLLGLDAVAGTGVEIYLSDVDVEPSRERLVHSERTRTARAAVIADFKGEIAALLNARIASAANLWDAKILCDQPFGPATGNALRRLAEGALTWRGIALGGADFVWGAMSGVEVRKYEPTTRAGATVNSLKTRTITAHPQNLVFLNDLSKNSTPRIAELYRRAPFKAAYVLQFDDDNARANFFRETHFETVPMRSISELPRPERAKRAPRTGNRRPFDAQLHSPTAPVSAIAAEFANGNGGSDDEFDKLKKWARTAPLDEANWPDFKRLYKAIEARLWPPSGRFRWDKTEADFPATPLPDARDLELLGVLMGRLDERNASRGAIQTLATAQPALAQPTLAQRAVSAVSGLIGRAPAPTHTAPSDNTLAYMKRRAARLLTFLRDNPALCDERREALAPLVSGLLQRDACADLNATLPLRLNLAQTEVLARNPDAIARAWSDATLPVEILRWSYQWLEERGQNVAVTPAHLRRFAELPDAEWTLKLAPAALQSGAKWPRDFGLKEFSQLLQGIVKGRGYAETRAIKDAFLARRGDILWLFVRFGQLEPDDKWLRASLGAVRDPIMLDWIAPWLRNWAQSGELALLQRMSPALRSRFNAAIVAAHPDGFALEKWRELSAGTALLQLLAPALRAVPISDEIADFLWGLPPFQRAPVLKALFDSPAILSLLEARARRLDWAFAAPLSAAQWEIFARAVAQSFPDGIGAAEWEEVAALPFQSGHNWLPLGAGFWEFALPLESAERAKWIGRVGAARAGREFVGQSAAVFEELLDSGASGLESLGDAWLDAHLGDLPLDGELIIKLAQSSISDWQARALRHLRRAELRLPVALRLMESELPILQRVAAPFFAEKSANWSERVLALADSPKVAARGLALRLLQEFPARWTPDLLRSLAQHDDAGVQAFVAAQLENAPAQIVESQAVEAFDHAILNARERARRAKNSVQSRVASAGEFDRETLLDAARNGAPRDREWALQQLVAASLAGTEVDGLQVEGAFAEARP